MQTSDPGAAAGTFLSLDAYDRSVAKLAHLAFVLYRKNGTAFIPGQHYYNTQILLRTKYVSQAVSKAEGNAYYFPYQDADDRLEGLFGMVRTLEHGSNFDV
eukprot:855506-Prymnesium_polylepis.1